MIHIQKSPTADSRACDYTQVSKEQLLSSSARHIKDVEKAMNYFRFLLQDAAEFHDADKLEDIDGFHANFLTGFEKHDWLDRHVTENRHHLSDPKGIPDNVNLIDVLEMVADCVMAGMARTGSVFPLVLPPELLLRALQNTVDQLRANVVVHDETAPKA